MTRRPQASARRRAGRRTACQAYAGHQFLVAHRGPVGQRQADAGRPRWPAGARGSGCRRRSEEASTPAGVRSASACRPARSRRAAGGRRRRARWCAIRSPAARVRAATARARAGAFRRPASASSDGSWRLPAAAAGHPGRDGLQVAQHLPQRAPGVALLDLARRGARHAGAHRSVFLPDAARQPQAWTRRSPSKPGLGQLVGPRAACASSFFMATNARYIAIRKMIVAIVR
jgi:hypothetical protein